MARRLTVKSETKRLNDIFKDLPPNELVVMSGMIDEAARMRVQMQQLHEIIDRDGMTIEFQQSDKVAPYKKISAEADMLLRIQKNYSVYISKMLERVPASERKSKLATIMDEFD